VSQKNPSVMEPASPKDMRRISRRSFAWAAGAIATTLGIGHWIFTRRQDGGVPWPLRAVLGLNENVWTDLFSSKRTAPTYSESQTTPERINGDEGDLLNDIDLSAWKLTLSGAYAQPGATAAATTDDSSDSTDDSGTSDTDMTLTLKQIQALPHVEQITELFCIEGWSIVQKWKGVRFRDFAAKYPPPNADGSAPDVINHPENLVPYVAMETPDGGYYVGLDMQSALHPQTLLCWEMNGKPLTQEHGAPLRLVIPVKYGVKNIKRIGTITYTADKPKDFWAEQGYDWYAGL
jgi:DMSO/TMAO reductase YedYZ molybdopterin-dependent catalytic subunit